MLLPERYKWEAQLATGEIITSAGAGGEAGREAVRLGDLAACARFSLIPAAPGLPQHDIVGVPMIRRFGRGFVRGFGGGLREYVYCVVMPSARFYVRCSDGAALLTPADYELYL